MSTHRKRAEPPRGAVSTSVEDFLSALRSLPRLPGASCRNDPEMWDDVTDPEPAQQICLWQCPAFLDCQAWAAAQPAGSLHGVVAGTVYTNHIEETLEASKRRRKRAG